MSCVITRREASFSPTVNGRATTITPEPSHLETFEELCHTNDAGGDLANDAYLAAITMELGATLVSLDRDFARFDGLDWRRPG